jgi:hypothetical protein
MLDPPAMIPVRPLILTIALFLASCVGQTGGYGPSSPPIIGDSATSARIPPGETRALESTEAATAQKAPAAAAARRGTLTEEPGDIWAVTKDWDKPRPPLSAPGAAARRRAQAAPSTPLGAPPPLQQEPGDVWSGVR